MMHHITYTTAERKLAWLARKLATNQDVLYHGTRYRQSILKMEVLFRPGALTDVTRKWPTDNELVNLLKDYLNRVYVNAVCFTRSPEVAAYFALLKRHNDEGRGSILVFDRQSLASQYKIKCNPEVFWHSNTTFHDEAEEQIFDNVTKIGDHLIGIVPGPTVKLSHRDKILNREFEKMMEARLQQLECQMTPRSRGKWGPGARQASARQLDLFENRKRAVFLVELQESAPTRS